MNPYGRRSRSPDRSRREDDQGWNARNTQGRNDNYRGRSPNGPQDRRGGGRQRSRSPRPQIDRYAPGRDDGAGRRDNYRRRSPPPPNPANIDRYVPGQEPQGPVLNILKHPMEMETQVGFSYFAEWWRKEKEVKEERERQRLGQRRPPPNLKGEREAREEREKEHADIQAAYDEYKEKCQAASAKGFVNTHKKEDWFREKYDPDIRNRFRQRLSELRRGVYAKWQGDLESGVFDEFTLEGIYKADSNGQGGVIEKEEGETATAAEVLGVGDLVPTKGGDIQNDAILEPALLIKTIAPNVSREDIEVLAKKCIGCGPGGFRWLSLSDPNPTKKFHRIGWIILVPGEAIQQDTMNDEEDGEAREDTDSNSNVVLGSALIAINGKSIGEEGKNSFTLHVGIHQPTTAPRKKALWDLFSAPERIWRDLQFATRLAEKFEKELGRDIDGFKRIEGRVTELKNGGLLQQPNNAPSGSRGASNDGEDEIEEREEGEEVEEEDDEKDDEDLLENKKKLDLLVEYLRRVFNFCFFCVFESDSVHELARKCPGGHLRRPRASLTSSAKLVAKASANAEAFPLKKGESAQEQGEDEADSPNAEKQPAFQKNNKAHQQLQRAFNWVKTYEEKLFQILEPETVDLKKLGGHPLGDALHEEMMKHVKREDEAKWRCKVPCNPECSKLFKGEHFWKKHVEKRHTEWFEGISTDLDEINQYVMDPAHITPMKGDATSNGHFPQPVHMQSGTPRGFNVAHMNPTMMNLPPNPAAMNFGGYPVTMPVPYGQQAMPAAPTGRGGGPIRNRGGRNNSRSAAPYDRNARGGQNTGWGGFPGRPGGPQPQRFPDAAADSGAPREATSGRSLRSYEDLDHVGGDQDQDGQGFDGELDY